jgi:hypothetical protein
LSSLKRKKIACQRKIAPMQEIQYDEKRYNNTMITTDARLDVLEPILNEYNRVLAE